MYLLRFWPGMGTTMLMSAILVLKKALCGRAPYILSSSDEYAPVGK